MWKYNKYNIGEIVGNHEIEDSSFQVIDVSYNDPEKPGYYKYSCRGVPGDPDNEMFWNDIKIYEEDDLYFICKPSYDQLERLLQEAKEKYDHSVVLLTTIAKQMDHLKNQH